MSPLSLVGLLSTFIWQVELINNANNTQYDKKIDYDVLQ